MSETLHASSPHISATVSASAGTGKTWLLVTRIVRLLLSGARPDGILAVTFTRKAAAEMQTRLNTRLLEMAQCSTEDLHIALEQIDAPTDAENLERARGLYEELLRSPYTVKTTTFHAFCQDILRRFPLEAGIAPGFELLESTAELQQAAWDALCTEASQHPNSDVAQAVETLFDVCDGLANTLASLNSFLAHRSDWWAYTETQQNPLAFAIENLTTQLQASPNDKPEQDFFNATTLVLLGEFAGLLRKHPGKKNAAALEALAVARHDDEDFPKRFHHCCQAFLTAKGTPLARKESKTQAKSMGPDGQQRFLELHAQICEAIETTRAACHAQAALQRITAWYQAGVRLLEHYQQLKTEQRVLDFSDLEWQAYQLLNHSDNVHWIQYKLDQRIDHLLIDEFQDTNPTQWRLLLPLFEELAAEKPTAQEISGEGKTEGERSRSVFLVGDSKQSIYRFRRADPELFLTAQDWLQKHLNAVAQPLNISWRSADAIMDFVNQVFGDGPLHQRLMQFSPHATHHPQLQGRVEFLPLIEQEALSETEPPPGLRDPLQRPRMLNLDQRHLEEGRLIAGKIQELMAANTLIGPVDAAHPMQYSDAIILLRHRTHAADYEQALREANIPYIGANRGALLHSLEVQDLVRLLELLVTPFNNLALASLLHSPLFDCSHNDLIELASIRDGHWMQRLTTIAPQHPSDSPLHRAHRLLSGWQTLVGKMPVHDLLDRIYCEADVLNRYHAASPAHLQHRVLANLTRFTELALEIDSGRYPTIGRFVTRLRTLRQQDQEAPDEGTPIRAGARVRLMTIHAAKGLEAPIIFLADAANTARATQAHRAVVDWPAQSPRPESFLLIGKKDQRDNFTQTILDRHAQAEAREDANLLYVAITRPKQWLYISGCRPNRGKELGWYGLMAEQCDSDTDADTQPIIFESGEQATTSQIGADAEAPLPNMHADLKQPLIDIPKQIVVAPSQSTPSRTEAPSERTAAADSDGRVRGIAIHRMLQLLCEGHPSPMIIQQISAEQGIAAHAGDLAHWFTETENTYHDPALQWIFAVDENQTTYNEAPIQYRLNHKTVIGIIDRLIVTPSEVWVIDYKSHLMENGEEMTHLVAQYREQIDLYCQGAARLWPEKIIHGGILFIHTKTFVEVG
jgi:ATP-dependent helicase/nuclease subunit A